MKIINIGILAHVDAGKTTLTESLLYTSGAIDELGSVELPFTSLIVTFRPLTPLSGCFLILPYWMSASIISFFSF